MWPWSTIKKLKEENLRYVDKHKDYQRLSQELYSVMSPYYNYKTDKHKTAYVITADDLRKVIDNSWTMKSLSNWF